MSEMIERVARVAYSAQWEGAFPAEGSIDYAIAMQVARAAIEEMLEPTGEMLKMGERQQASDRGGADSTYIAMIEAALE